MNETFTSLILDISGVSLMEKVFRSFTEGLKTHQYIYRTVYIKYKSWITKHFEQYTMTKQLLILVTSVNLLTQ